MRLEQVLCIGVARRPVEHPASSTDAARDIYKIVKEKLNKATLSPPPLVIAIANAANGLHALMKNTGEILLDSASNRYYTTGKAVHERIKQLDRNEEDGGIGLTEVYGGAWQVEDDEHWMTATWNQWDRSKPRYDKFVTIVLIARFFAETYIEDSDEQIVYLLSEDIKENKLSHDVKWIESAKAPGKVRFEMGSTGIKGVIDKVKIKYDDLGKNRDKYIRELRSKAKGLPIEILVTGNNKQWVALDADGTRAFTKSGLSLMQDFVGEEKNLKFVPISQTAEGFYERHQALRMVMPPFGRAVTVIGYGGETGQVTTSSTNCVLYGSLGEKAEVAKLVQSARDTYEFAAR
jgi:hypothetical protein